MKNINEIKKEECTGCMNCLNACPKKCISKKEDSEGFLYPFVNEEKCINCSICLKNCHLKKESTKFSPFLAYAIQSNDSEELKNSASGGIAFVLCKKAIKDNGVAYGAIFDDSFKVLHSRADNIEDLKKQQGSKYVQSDITEVFSRLKEDCISGRKVVFIGTPCQVVAIRNYLKKDYDNLLLVDLICHGVPSPKLFSKYIDWKTKKMNDGPILKYSFRDKTKGWGTNFKATTKNKKQFGNAMREPYYSDFEDAINYRLSCYNCKYATRDRVGDITIGDYWGITKLFSKLPFDPKNGVSCILVNNNKGKEAIEDILPVCKYVSTTVEQVANNNSNLNYPAKKEKIRDKYYQLIDKYGINYSKWLLYRKKSYYRSLLISMIPERLKQKIKEMRKK